MNSKKYTCLIVDDNKVARLLLKQLIEKIGKIEVIGEAETAEAARVFIESQPVDILFLDIEMPGGMSGIELLEVLTERPLTILTTAKQGYAVQAFELNVVDYLVKPFTLQRISVAVERAIELLSSHDVKLDETEEEKFLFIKDNKVIRKLDLNEILWIEAKGDYVNISTPDRNFVLHLSLRSLEDKLPPQKFIRTHRSYIIALGKIDFIEERLVNIQNRPIPISDTYRNDLLKRLGLS